jgi:hypothetical protein
MKLRSVSWMTLRTRARNHPEVRIWFPQDEDRVSFPPLRSSARRTYAKVVGLLLVACYLPLVIGTLDMTSRYGVHWAQDAIGWLRCGKLTAGIVVFFWLCWLVIARTTLDRVPPWQRLVQRGSAVVCGATALYAAFPGATVLGYPEGSSAVFGGAVAWLALEVCRAHGVLPGPRHTATPAEALRNWRIGEAAFNATAVGAGTCFLLTQLLRWADIDGVPVMQGSQLEVIGVDGPAALALGVMATVLLENVVVVVATTALLTAIRRPSWEIYTLVCGMDILLHSYFGLAAIGMALHAAGRVWLYRRYRRLTPLLASHAVLDLIGGSAQLLLRHSLIYGLAPGVLLCIGAGLWERRLKTAAQAAEPQQPPLSGSRPVPNTPEPHDVTSRPTT